MKKLKEYGINFDRIIYLNDTSEQEPGIELARRVKSKQKSDLQYDWEKENEFAQKNLASVKEFYTEEIVKEISCLGQATEVFVKIRTEIDPFFVLPDNSENCLTTADDVNIEDQDSGV